MMESGASCFKEWGVKPCKRRAKGTGAGRERGEMRGDEKREIGRRDGILGW